MADLPSHRIHGPLFVTPEGGFREPFSRWLDQVISEVNGTIEVTTSTSTSYTASYSAAYGQQTATRALLASYGADRVRTLQAAYTGAQSSTTLARYT